MKKFLSKTSRYLVEILPFFALSMAVFCVIALLSIIIEGFSLPFDISPKGFQHLLKLFEPYSTLFSATLALILAIEAFKRLRLMQEANLNTFRASNRTIWTQTVKEFLSDEIKKKDPGVVVIINKNILNLHDFFFDIGYQIDNHDGTIGLFNAFFKDEVGYMENMNRHFQSIGCYPDYEKSFSWDSFRLLISVMLIRDVYPDFWQDLRHLYQEGVIASIKQHQHMVDMKMYKDNLVTFMMI